MCPAVVTADYSHKEIAPDPNTDEEEIKYDLSGDWEHVDYEGSLWKIDQSKSQVNANYDTPNEKGNAKGTLD